ncbi:zinc finger CCCH domain-containing protein 3 [Pseudomyrmex gracilis]|uniref:zinc finger CCCH domain-containing protein 3 n=1 Tax=Pseudomyrmex gracilis TaxID=219809 RepID=UPI000994CDF7|nr:zinc finger CCCH domain-containing protein 3 [Pseudomyrmex gracilis]
MGGPSSAIAEANIFNELCIIKNQIEKLIAIQSAKKMNCPNRNFIYVKPQVCTAPKNEISFISASVPKKSSQNQHIDPKLLPTTSVHINPNFIPQKPTVHINPSVHAKDVHMIHVNPKIMNHIVNPNQCTPSNRANLSATETNIDKTVNPSNVKTSIHVNPTLLKHLKETMTNSKEPVTKEQSVCSKSKPFKNISNQISPKRTSNTGIVHLSRRKLVRVASTTKVSKTPISQGNKSINRSKVTKYKIDRTVLQVKKLKRNCLERRKVRDDMTKLVTIGDIVYKASKNKLVRNNSPLKRRKSISGKSSKLSIATSAKKQRALRRSFNMLNRTLETSSKTRHSFNISPKTTYKNSISNKAKQKSIRILRNKMHKNNQPCLIFQRFGSCPNHNKGTCPKKHDKKQVSLCKKFLQGKCLLDKCPLSHDIGPEKMPTCKYFLDGRCTRDNCPYVHVKVSSTTLICIDFLRGYCAKGNKCQRRHQYLCPEFDRAGKCKLEKCPYPHKSHSSHPEKNAKYSSKTRDVREHQAASTARNESETPNPESRPRYYEVTNDVSREFEKKKDTVHCIDFDSSVKETDKSLPRENGHASETKSNTKEQVCIGGYIPIDPSN